MKWFNRSSDERRLLSSSKWITERMSSVLGQSKWVSPTLSLNPNCQPVELLLTSKFRSHWPSSRLVRKRLKWILWSLKFALLAEFEQWKYSGERCEARCGCVCGGDGRELFTCRCVSESSQEFLPCPVGSSYRRPYHCQRKIFHSWAQNEGYLHRKATALQNTSSRCHSTEHQFSWKLELPFWSEFRLNIWKFHGFHVICGQVSYSRVICGCVSFS